MAAAQSSAPPFFNFLKEGLLLPTRNGRLFAAVFAIIVASSSLLLLGNHFSAERLHPVVQEILTDAVALNGTDPSSPEHLHILHEMQGDTWRLLTAGTVQLLVSVVIGWAAKLVAIFAAVATFSGKLHTLASLLASKAAVAQLKGPVLTLAFVAVLKLAYAALLVAMAVPLLAFFTIRMYALVFVDALLLVVASIFLVYLYLVCSLGIIVAVDEPGCHGAAAVLQAWPLTKGKRMRAVLLIVVDCVLAAAFWLAKTYALSTIASGLLLGFLYNILMAAAQVFGTCAITAFYCECKGSTEAWATEYIKVSTVELKHV